MPKLTVIIPCKNERLNIRPCIESVRAIADEVLVADSGSTDGTLEIVRSMGGCRIVEREYVHSGDFKNWVIPQAAHPWVLILDADERVTPELAAEIKQVLAKEPDVDGFELYRNGYFMGHLVKHCGWDRDHIIRLFRRDVSRFYGDNDHAHLVVATGKVGWLKGRIDHFTFWTYDQYFSKSDRYTSWQARQWYIAGKRPSYMNLMFCAPFTFFKFYILNLGILDGAIGLQLSMLKAFYSFSKQARLWELHRARRQPDPELEHTIKSTKPTRQAA